MASPPTPAVAAALALTAAAAASAALHEVQIPAMGAPLPRPPVWRSQNGSLSVTASLDALRLLSPDVDLVTRGFSGSVPAPTIAVLPGDRLSILIKNELQTPFGPDAFNKEHHPNNTNLHVHGLHVSPLPPGDAVFDTILAPGQSSEFKYDILPGHSPGTYWWHPHYHGSADLQTGAGAAGGIIVLDPPGFLSPQLAAVQDRLLMVIALAKPVLEKAARIAKDALFHVDRWPADAWGPTNDKVVLVNGAMRPVLTARPGEWQRLRLVAALPNAYANLTFGACELALLAKDGIYIADFPRFVSHVYLLPGSRADVLVRCPGGPQGTTSEHSVTEAFKYKGLWFTIRVEGKPATGLAAEELVPWSPPQRPAYLRDLRAEHVAPECVCQTAQGIGGNNRWVEGHLFRSSHSWMHSSPRDTVVERRLTGVNTHPYHQHTWPFQLQETPTNAPGGAPYFKAGDWHDTYANVLDAQRHSLRVRFNTVDWHGPMVVHCHTLAHTDVGMIAVERVEDWGTQACGCDLLDEPTQVSRAATEVAGLHGLVLRSSAAAAFLVMLGIALGLVPQLRRAWRAGAAERNAGLRYEALAPGPHPPA